MFYSSTIGFEAIILKWCLALFLGSATRMWQRLLQSSYEFLLFHSVADACLCQTVELEDIFTYFSLLHYTTEPIRRFFGGFFLGFGREWAMLKKQT